MATASLLTTAADAARKKVLPGLANPAAPPGILPVVPGTPAPPPSIIPPVKMPQVDQAAAKVPKVAAPAPAIAPPPVPMPPVQPLTPQLPTPIPPVPLADQSITAPTVPPPATLPPALPAVPTPGVTAPGSTVLPPTPAPAAVPGASTFGADQNLLTTQVNPTTDPRLAGTQSAVDAAAQALGTTPNRSDIAASQLDLLTKQSDPAYQASLRLVGQNAAKFGRIGAGMTTNDLTGLAQSREQMLANARQGLAADTAGQQMGDVSSKLAALSGLESQQYGQGAASRGEVRTERGYQQGLSQQANQDAIAQALAESQLQQQQDAADRGWATTQAGIGYGANPSSTLLPAAAGQAAAGQGAIQSAADLARQSAATGVPKSFTPAGSTTPAGQTPQALPPGASVRPDGMLQMPDGSVVDPSTVSTLPPAPAYQPPDIGSFLPDSSQWGASPTDPAALAQGPNAQIDPNAIDPATGLPYWMGAQGGQGG